ncbi:MAG: hypothetical protein K6U11_03470 [bacterium]|nr:hypothetical protein [bacterium]
MNSGVKILAMFSLWLVFLLITFFLTTFIPQRCLAQKIMATQEIKEVEIDIEPGLCPNPLNVESQGTLPVAILGTLDLNIARINPQTIELEGVRAVQYRREDVSTTVFDRQDICDCTIEGKDGMIDLVLEFNISDVVSTIGQVDNDDVAVLTITGSLFDGTPIEGEDCVVIQKP